MKHAVRLALVGLAVLGGYALQSNSQAEEPAKTAAPSYVLAAPGQIEPASEERQIGSEVIGTLSEVLVEDIDVVKAGQVIAVIDNDDQLALLAQAKAQLEAAKAEVRVAELDYERQNALHEKRNASTATLDSARAQLDVAKAEVLRAQASVELATANLDKTRIKSPIDGVVLKKLVVAGGAVSNQPPTPIAVIGDLSQLNVRAEVDELDIGKVQVGQKVEVKADAYPNQTITGTVVRVNKRIGVRQVQTDRSSERTDNKVLQVLIKLDEASVLPVNLRVDAFFLPAP